MPARPQIERAIQASRRWLPAGKNVFLPFKGRQLGKKKVGWVLTQAEGKGLPR